MRDEHAQAGEMDGAGSERFEDCGPAPGGSGDADAVVGGALGESELLHAEHMHRREGALGVELPLVDLGEVKEQLRLGCTGSANELPRAGEKIVIVHHGDCRIYIDHAINGSTLLLRTPGTALHVRAWTRRAARRTHVEIAPCGRVSRINSIAANRPGNELQASAEHVKHK